MTITEYLGLKLSKSHFIRIMMSVVVMSIVIGVVGFFSQPNLLVSANPNECPPGAEKHAGCKWVQHQVSLKCMWLPANSVANPWHEIPEGTCPQPAPTATTKVDPSVTPTKDTNPDPSATPTTPGTTTTQTATPPSQVTPKSSVTPTGTAIPCVGTCPTPVPTVTPTPGTCTTIDCVIPCWWKQIMTWADTWLQKFFDLFKESNSIQTDQSHSLATQAAAQSTIAAHFAATPTPTPVK